MKSLAMPRVRAVLTLLMALAALSSGAERSENYVVLDNDNKVYGTAIQAKEDGTILLARMEGGNQTFKRGSYKAAMSAKPKALEQAEQMVEGGKCDQAVQALDTIFKTAKYLGWAGRIAHLKGGCLLAAGDAKGAERAYDEGMRYPMSSEDKTLLRKDMIDVLLALGEIDGAKKLLSKMDTTDMTVAAQVFNSRGKLLTAEGKKKEAVLNYLKTILLVPDDDDSNREAYAEVIKLLKELKDNRAVEFEREMKARFK